MPAMTAEVQPAAVRIPIAGEAWLNADLTMPADAAGLVVFAHGSGSSRLSPRNRRVARQLNANGLGTLLADLLTDVEEIIDEKTRGLRFDIPLLTRRLVQVIDWARVRDNHIGLFGASTGAAAALDAAAMRPDIVRAVVSRGGRPDLASRLGDVVAPTLLIVGDDDTEVLDLNRRACRMLRCPNAASFSTSCRRASSASATTASWRIGSVPPTSNVRAPILPTCPRPLVLRPSPRQLPHTLSAQPARSAT